MPTLDEILNNPDFADDLELSLGDKGTLKLSELRTGLRTRDEQLAAAARERDDYRGKHSKLEESITSLLSLAGKQTDDDNRREPENPKKTLKDAMAELLAEDDPSEKLFSDPLFGKALSKAEERAYARAAAENAKLKDEFDKLSERLESGFKSLTQAQLSERAQRWYDVNRKEIPTDKDGKRISLTDLHKFALERNMVVPGSNLADYDAALETLTEPTRRQSALETAKQEGFRAGLEQGRAAAGKVIPFMSDRSAGGVDKGQYKTEGKGAKQIISERLAQGLAELSAEEG